MLGAICALLVDQYCLETLLMFSLSDNDQSDVIEAFTEASFLDSDLSMSHLKL